MKIVVALLSLMATGVLSEPSPRFITITPDSQMDAIENGECGEDMTDTLYSMSAKFFADCANEIIPEGQEYLIGTFQNLVPVGDGRKLEGRKLEYNHCDRYCGTEEKRKDFGEEHCCILACICELPGWRRELLPAEVSEDEFADALSNILEPMDACVKEKYDVVCNPTQWTSLIDATCFGCADGDWLGSIASYVA